MYVIEYKKHFSIIWERFWNLFAHILPEDEPLKTNKTGEVEMRDMNGDSSKAAEPLRPPGIERRPKMPVPGAAIPEEGPEDEDAEIYEAPVLLAF